jgi:DnaJ-class molecular chaperone
METVMIECPDCGGEGTLETLIRLTQEGDQTWRTDRCERCGGSGKIEAPVQEEE